MTKNTVAYILIKLLFKFTKWIFNYDVFVDKQIKKKFYLKSIDIEVNQYLMFKKITWKTLNDSA